MSEQKQTDPVHLTPSAIKKLKAMRSSENKEDCGLRVAVVTGGCAGLSYDLRFQKTPYENDVVVEQDGLKVFINPESLAFLKGIEIDYVDTLKMSGFQYRNPNAQKSCGCGTSFS